MMKILISTVISNTETERSSGLAEYNIVKILYFNSLGFPAKWKERKIFLTFSLWSHHARGKQTENN